LSLLIFDGFIEPRLSPLIRAETLFELVDKEFLLFLFYVLSLAQQYCGFVCRDLEGLMVCRAKTEEVFL
jgi:hypothetical protein